VYLTPPLKGFPWNWVSAQEVKSLNDAATRLSKTFWVKFSNLYTIPAVTDGRTDWHVAVAKTAVCHMRRAGKNVTKTVSVCFRHCDVDVLLDELYSRKKRSYLGSRKTQDCMLKRESFVWYRLTVLVHWSKHPVSMKRNCACLVFHVLETERYYAPPPWPGHCAMTLSDVCLSDVWRLSRTLGVSPKSRTETKIGIEVAHVTCDSDTTIEVKRSKVNVTWSVSL